MATVEECLVSQRLLVYRVIVFKFASNNQRFPIMVRARSASEESYISVSQRIKDTDLNEEMFSKVNVRLLWFYGVSSFSTPDTFLAHISLYIHKGPTTPRRIQFIGYLGIYSLWRIDITCKYPSILLNFYFLLISFSQFLMQVGVLGSIVHIQYSAAIFDLISETFYRFYSCDS